MTDSAFAAHARIVAIGASAGGITALQALFRALPAEPGFAFVVVQHLMPDAPCRLPQLIESWGAMPVEIATDGTVPRANRVYVAAPRDRLTLEDGVFRTQPAASSRQRVIDSVDTFFESLAADRGADAVAIVLSGTGNDGMAGAICIRKAGGLVLAQEPETAMHEGMPGAVIASGAADGVMSPARMAQALLDIASPSYERSASPWSEEVRQTLDHIVELIRGESGIDLTGFKASPLLWRIRQRMEVRRTRTFCDYEALLHDDPAELAFLIRGIPIHVTQFFRDAAAWDVLEREVIAKLVDERESGEPIRAWTPACATGEEAYSLAMLIDEKASAHDPPLRYQVFATDSSADVITRAGRGIFSQAAVQSLPAERRERWFYAVDGNVRVRKSLRQHMIFAEHDLLGDPPFTRLDLVTCRNLLIYLERETAERALFHLHASLRTGGYLFLGAGEGLSRRQDGFEIVSQQWRIYRKTGPIGDARFELPKKVAGPRRPARVAAAPSPRPEPHDPETWSDALRVSYEELDASREELEAVNEELKASNEQLGVSNDEVLQVNAKMREKIAELEMQSRVLSSGAVMTLFLDEELRVRWFTPGVRELFPLTADDTGRPLTDLAPKFDDVHFFDEVRTVIRTSATSEGEVRTRDGRWYLRRIRPYRTKNEATVGAAVNFTDITDRKRLEGQQRFLLELSDTLRQLTDPQEIHAAATAGLGRQLEVSGCAYGHAAGDGDEFVSLRDYCRDGLRSVAGRHRLSDFGPFVAQRYHAGEALVLSDVLDSPVDEESRPAFAAVGARAVVGTPIVKHGELVAVMSVYDASPRRWTPDEIALVEETGQRTWAAVEHVRTEAALREREAERAAQTRALERLHESGSRLWQFHTLQEGLDEMLAVTMELTHADSGNVQIVDEQTGECRIVAHRGLDERSVDTLRSIVGHEAAACTQAMRRGQRVLVEDTEDDPLVAPLRHVSRSLGVRAIQSTPLIGRSGRTLGVVSTYGREPHRPAEQELRLLDLYVRVTTSFVERYRWDEALRAAEERYLALFNAIDQGFCTLEVAFDDEGRATDYRFLETSPSFERHTGITNAVGRWMREIAPEQDEHWFELYGSVARTGEPVRLEQISTPLGRWWHVYAFRIGKPEERRVGVLFTDVTERKEAEAVLRKSEGNLRAELTNVENRGRVAGRRIGGASRSR